MEALIYIICATLCLFSLLAFRKIRIGGSKICDAANEIGNRTLHEGGKSIYEGANILFIIYIILIALIVIIKAFV